MEISLLAAFLGGVLALLSPCGALLLPAFFASTLGAGSRLLAHGAVFFVGLSLTLVPLGLGASFVGSLVTTERDLLITVAGWLIVAFGIAQILGFGFDLSRVLPGARNIQATAPRRTGVTRSFLLGTVSGIAGFCSGPILGAVLTMAATEDNLVAAGGLLAVYGAGMVVPLFLLVAAWGRLGTAGRARLRGRELAVGPLRLHTTSVITGVLLVAVGVVFLRTNGMAALPELLPAALLAQLQRAVLTVSAAVPEQVVIVVAALAALAVWFVLRRRAAEEPGDDPAGAAEPVAAGERVAVAEPDVAAEPVVAGEPIAVAEPDAARRQS
ncbi:cytochrome c biogenesis CcdA family protein [Georgenia muralis]|uniref:Cytochrome c biogenesis protein CcdA n=1 Tax=Georgenia muralis TaxID=154117 RepID=A0A3N5A8R6_9MICO|nr:cytochrome c biogenesis CcdA family protein [Georgenia muralis]RPF28051.1 cytochrome c biogenesis protein CcdA [Georgenia muralis]